MKKMIVMMMSHKRRFFLDIVSNKVIDISFVMKKRSYQQVPRRYKHKPTNIFFTRLPNTSLRNAAAWSVARTSQNTTEPVQNLQTIEKTFASPSLHFLPCWDALPHRPRPPRFFSLSFLVEGKVSEAWRGGLDHLHCLVSVFCADRFVGRLTRTQ